MLDYDYCYIGRICQILDNAKVNYHHCNTWFRLFLNDGNYSIETEKINNISEVLVYKGDNISWCHNTKAPIMFQGTLQDFEKWLEQAINKKMEEEVTYEIRD